MGKRVVLGYNDCERNNYQYVVVEVSDDFPVNRDEIVHVLHAENILARRYFWPGCHNMMPYRAFYPHAGMLLSNTTEVANRVIVLPTGAAIGRNQIEVTADIFEILSSLSGFADIVGG